MQELSNKPVEVELDPQQVEERFEEISAQLGEDSELLDAELLAELENTPVLKPSGTHDQGYRFN